MFSKLKRILYPENMLFKMIILNCGLLLLVTLVLTAAGNYIYEESIAEDPMQTQWKSRIRC